jgi:hypothetical protein
MADVTFPFFAFQRRHAVELEAGFSLAGQLFLNVPAPETRKMSKRVDQTASNIVQMLAAAAQTGKMPLDAIVYGWPGGHKPPNAVDVHDEAVMGPWAKKCLVIGVRVDPRPNDGFLRLDSDALQQMGLANPAPDKTQ